MTIKNTKNGVAGGLSVQGQDVPSATSAGIAIKDASGQTLFWIDTSQSGTLRDVNGKPVGAAVDDGDISLARCASHLMSGRDVRVNESGKLVLMDLAVSEVASPTAARASFVTTANDFIADEVAPVKLVAHTLGFVLVEAPSDSIMQAVDLATAPGGAPPTADLQLLKLPFTAQGYGIGCRIPTLTVQNADFDLKLAALRRCIVAVRLAREVRVANLVMASGSWATSAQIAATANWNGGASASPLDDVSRAKAASFLPPTSLVISEAAEQHFFANANSTRVRDYVEAGGQLPRVLVGRARTMAAGVPNYVWSPSTPANAVLLRDPADPKTDIGTVRTLRWLGQSPASVEVDGLLVRAFEHEDYSYIVVVHNDSEIMLQSPSNIGALITGVLA